MDTERQPVSPESRFDYVDKTTGTAISFEPKPDEAMVTFVAAPTEDTLNELVEDVPVVNSVSQGYNLQRGFAAVYVTPQGDEEAVGDALDAQPGVANSMPVLVDEHGAARYFLPDEFTVQFRDDVTADRADELIAQHGSSVVVAQRTPGYFTLAVPSGSGLFETIREFADLDEVAFAEPSEVSFNSAQLYLPDDADFGQLWGMHNTGQTVNGTAGTADADIDAAEAWDLVRGDPEVIVAVIDTGADLDHPDLASNLLPRGSEDWDFADGGDPSPDDADGHGTHVAGTAAGADNTVGVIGVAPGCRIMPLRVDLATGMNQNRADAINYVRAQALANPGRRYVVNCSWRMNGDHAGVRTAIQNAVASNVVIVYAAGNANTNTDITPQFPGVYPEVISVAALDQQSVRAGFSNFGTNVDVAAPGVNIWSSMPNDTWGFLDGTSMASPHVAGLAALVWSRNLDLTNEQVRRIIESTCDDIDAVNPGFAGMLGAGRINAYRAVTSPLLFASTQAPSADLTGDRRADLLGFGDAGVWVSLNNGAGGYPQPTKVIDDFAYVAGGWRVQRHPRFLADLTGDRRADIVGFGDRFVWVSRNNGNGTFQPLQPVIENFAYSSGQWRVEKHPRFVVDLTGDGRADIIGFGDRFVWVARNHGDGTFAPMQPVLENFCYVSGTWRVEKHPRFLADLTGDGRPDIVGFGDAGVWVSFNNGDATFQPPVKVIDDFGYEAGRWRVEKHPRFLADVTGDGRADIVGFGDAGVWIARNNGNGTFQAPTKVIDDFAYVAGGWRVDMHPRFVTDLTGDGRADLLGFGYGGVWVSRNNGNGSFQPIARVVDDFGYGAGGWRVEKHPRFLADLTGDGRPDIVGFGEQFVWTSRNNGNGTFQAPQAAVGNFAYSAGNWRVEKHPRHAVGPR